MTEIKDGTNNPLPRYGNEVAVVALHHEDPSLVPGKVYKGYYVAFPKSELGDRRQIHFITDDAEAAKELTKHRGHGFYGTPGTVYEYPIVYGEGGMLYLHTDRAVVHTTDFDKISEAVEEVEALREENHTRARALARLTPRERELLGL